MSNVYTLVLGMSMSMSTCLLLSHSKWRKWQPLTGDTVTRSCLGQCQHVMDSEWFGVAAERRAREENMARLGVYGREGQKCSLFTAWSSFAIVGGTWMTLRRTEWMLATSAIICWVLILSTFHMNHTRSEHVWRVGCVWDTLRSTLPVYFI